MIYSVSSSTYLGNCLTSAIIKIKTRYHFWPTVNLAYQISQKNKQVKIFILVSCYKFFNKASWQKISTAINILMLRSQHILRTLPSQSMLSKGIQDFPYFSMERGSLLKFSKPENNENKQPSGRYDQIEQARHYITNSMFNKVTHQKQWKWVRK